MMRALVAAACVVLLAMVLRAASSVVGPIALAVFLAIAIEPVVLRLQRAGVPRIAAATITTLATAALLVGLTALLFVACGDLVEHAPRLSARLRDQAHGLAAWLHRHHLGDLATAVDHPDGLVDRERASALAGTAAATLLSTVQTVVIVLLTTLFVQLDAPGFRAALRRRARQLLPITPPDQRLPERVIDDGLARIRRYVVVKACVSLVGGALLGLWCWLWGVEGALVWAVLASVLNFVPVIGSLIAAVPPVALALLTAGPGAAIGVASGYVAVNLIVDNLIEPRVMGRAVGLSPLVILIAMMCWGFALGALGALLAVPLTLALQTGLRLAGRDQIADLMADQPPPATIELEAPPLALAA